MLFGQLRQDGVRIGVYKNTAQIEAGLRGETDLDLLAARDDADAMRRTLRQCGGVPAQPGRFHDNTGANREDWFVPLGDCRFLHLDIAIGITIGPKYRKRYRVFDYADVRDWQTLQAADGVRLSCVSPQDELRIALLRSVFQPVSDNQIEQAGEDDAALQPLPYRIGAEQFSCKPVATPSGPSLTESDRRKMRKAVRRQASSLNGSNAIADWSIHTWRRALNALSTRMTAMRTGSSRTRRSLQPQGIIAALIGPDGVGKSTQAARLQAIFGRKFRCASVYLGSNDGSWTQLRRRIGGKVARKKSSIIESPSKQKPSGKSSNGRSWAHATGSAVWRLLVAIQRLTNLHRARRLAASGALVICDRWPQTIAPGMLDGPALPPPPNRRLARLISRAEHALYRRMERYSPDLSIHLDCDFATSYARKPGDIEEADFEKRLDLMQQMRQRNAGDGAVGASRIAVVDARQELDEVSADLCRHIWAALSRNAAREEPA